MSVHDLTTPGGMIRSHREERGMSLADLSASTKIPVPVLEAIEHNEFHKVSGALYIKSFLRTCAAALGLDEGEVLSKYAQFSGEFDSGVAPGQKRWREEDVQISRIGLPWRGIGIGAAILAGLALIVVLSVRGCHSGQEQTQSVAAVVESKGGIAATIAKSDADRETETSDEQVEATVEQQAPPATRAYSANDSLSRSFENSSLLQNDKSEDTAEKNNNIPASSQTEEVGQARSIAPLAITGDNTVDFSGNESRKVVLRILCQEQVEIEVKRDAERSFSVVQWPSTLGNVLDLPNDSIEAGRVYRVAEGFALYWGADDHFNLKLAGTDGVNVTLNGVRRDVARLKPGGEVVLDTHGN
ncbi:MAG: cytoskeleton protein RodZ [Candidatus Krumholzibacteriia bacterium]|jgi:cytoskeleton protein RodZ